MYIGIIIGALIVFICLWLFNDWQKRKFDAEQAKLREDRKRNLEQLKAEKAQQNSEEE